MALNIVVKLGAQIKHRAVNRNKIWTRSTVGSTTTIVCHELPLDDLPQSVMISKKSTCIFIDTNPLDTYNRAPHNNVGDALFDACLLAVAMNSHFDPIGVYFTLCTVHFLLTRVDNITSGQEQGLWKLHVRWGFQERLHFKHKADVAGDSTQLRHLSFDEKGRLLLFEKPEMDTQVRRGRGVEPAKVPRGQGQSSGQRDHHLGEPGPNLISPSLDRPTPAPGAS